MAEANLRRQTTDFPFAERKLNKKKKKNEFQRNAFSFSGALRFNSLVQNANRYIAGRETEGKGKKKTFTGIAQQKNVARTADPGQCRRSIKRKEKVYNKHAPAFLLYFCAYTFGQKNLKKKTHTNHSLSDDKISHTSIYYRILKYHVALVYYTPKRNLTVEKPLNNI